MRRSHPLTPLLFGLAAVVALGVAGAVVAAMSAGVLAGLAPGIVAALAAGSFLVTRRALRVRTRTDAIDAAMDDLERRIGEARDERLELRMRAETAGRFREEFVAAVRHELKTPLNVILGFTDVLLQEVDGPLTASQREDVGAIRSAGMYLQGLVEAVLAEWAPQRDVTADLEPVALGPLLADVAHLLRGQVVDKPVELQVEVDPETPAIVADPRRLRQIVINLCTNAIRATAKGWVRLEAAPADEDHLRLTVRDTGRGLREEEIPKLFDEFEQAGSQQSRRGGAGLGLSLTREMVEWHGGRIEVESTLGEGSAFTVILPREAD